MNTDMKSPTTSIRSASPHRGKHRLCIILIGLLILLVVGTGFTVFSLLPHQSSPATTATTVGYAFFKSSGQLDEGNSQGINDQLQIELQGISDPAAGKSYYAWLLGDLPKDKNKIENHCQPQQELIALGKVPVEHGKVDFSYTDESQHTNLISCTSRLLITQEDANSVPLQPSKERYTWVYYAEIPQLPDPHDPSHFSVLDNIRHLLHEGPDLSRQGIHGGLDIQLLRNTQKLLEWAGSARDAWDGAQTPDGDAEFIHRQIIRILDYLDGTYLSKTNTVPLVQTDVPPGTPILVDRRFALVPLLDLPGHNTAYLARINTQFDRIAVAPGVTVPMRTLAKQISGYLPKVRSWLQNVYEDAKALLPLTHTQLRQPSTLTLLDDLQVQANSVLVGQLDPSTGKVAPGVVQIHYSIQQLATFDLKPCVSNPSCSV